MADNSIQRFIELRDQLASEKQALVKRLQAIERALAGEAARVIPAAAAPATRTRKKRKVARGARNAMSLKAATIRCLKVKPLNKEEILAAVKAIGYKFRGGRPIASLNTMLYSNTKLFKRVGDRFTFIGK